MRTYELVFVADPRLSDEEAVELADTYKAQIEADKKSRVTKEESWGRKKLAYPINKLTEGRYHLYYIDAPGDNGLAEVEQRLRQNDKVLRHLVVRTDLDLKRAAAKGKPPREPQEGDEPEKKSA